MRRGNNKACAPTTCSFSGLAKNKHWENYSCIEAHKAGKEIGDVTQRDHVTHLKKKANTHSPQDIVKFPFYLHGGTRTKAPRARGCFWAATQISETKAHTRDEVRWQ